MIEVKTRQDGQKRTKRKGEKRERLVPHGPKALAFVTFRHLDGRQQQLRILDGWKLHSEDPFDGHRKRLADDVRSRKHVLTLPAPTKNPPVEKGEVFHLANREVVIEKTTRKLLPGSAEWHIDYMCPSVEKPMFLRSTVPAAEPDELVKPPTAEEIEKARIHGNYRSRPEAGGDPLSVVPDDWEDVGRAERETRRQEQRREIRVEESTKEEIRRFKARVSQVCGELGKKGHDLTPLLSAVYERLAEAERELREAA